MLVMIGPGAPGGNTVSVGETAFSFKFLTTGSELVPRVEGDKVVIGGQTVSMTDGDIVLGTMGGPWKPKT